MNSQMKMLALGSLAAAMMGCATTATNQETTIAKEVQAQPAREMHGEVAAKGMEAIMTSKSLNDEQKKQLMSLHGDMARETFKIQEETGKLKAVLFETITTKPFDRSKVNSLKKKIVALNDKKMKNMFSALDKVQTIIGDKTDTDIQDFYRPFFWEQSHQNQAM